MKIYSKFMNNHKKGLKMGRALLCFANLDLCSKKTSPTGKSGRGWLLVFRLWFSVGMQKGRGSCLPPCIRPLKGRFYFFVKQLLIAAGAAIGVAVHFAGTVLAHVVQGEACHKNAFVFIRLQNKRIP